ncbi:hypothetical protein ACH5RR_035014 [Cinchona calisaya]|uniref:PNPLA domain-containing protein n=1 Tax=Cinchona calisaya TaxID=153742 RepID=A0ABD2YHZ0_9GENT
MISNLLLGQAEKLVKAVTGPKYDGKYLHNLLHEKLGEIKMKHQSSLDALPRGICIGTSAAPTYLPAHKFEAQDSDGSVREFNLIDDGVAANNPALVAINQVTKVVSGGNSDFFCMKPLEYDRFIVLSLGSGTANEENKYDADEAAKWGIFGWLTNTDAFELLNKGTNEEAPKVGGNTL